MTLFRLQLSLLCTKQFEDIRHADIRTWLVHETWHATPDTCKTCTYCSFSNVANIFVITIQRDAFSLVGNLDSATMSKTSDASALAHIRRESLDIYNRLHSINADIAFVNDVRAAYPTFPLIRTAS